MKQYLKYFLFVLVGFALIITLISLLIPSKIVVRKAVTVTADSATVANKLADVALWTNWFTPLQDSTAVIVQATPELVKWEQNEKINELVYLGTKKHLQEFDLQVEKSSFKQTYLFAIMPMSTDSAEISINCTNITYLGKLPWNKFKGIFLEKMLGDFTEQQLLNLQQYIETPSPASAP